jgi:hypothetical protein
MCRLASTARALALAALLLPCAARAEDAKEKGIQDNSFLLEEAYNQDPRVVQHISSFTFAKGSHEAIYTFTQEWPAGSLAHQLSYTLPIQNLPETGGGTRLGDVALNYRYQLAGDGDALFACAPRFSVTLPTGSARLGYGSGAVGYQLDVPVSVVLSKAFVTHVNAGVTLVPHAEDSSGDEATTFGKNVGWSLVWLAKPTFNFLVETLYSWQQDVTGSGTAETRTQAIVSPGVRFAWNFPSGLQIVPGLAFPIGVGPSAGERSVLLYLSFEHPF